VLPHQQVEDPYTLLREAARSVDPGYNNSTQMNNDFRSVFFSTPEGNRVFHQIMEWAGFFRTAVVKGDPYGTHVREGERNIGARVWSACLREPTEKPTQTQRRYRNG